MRRFRCFLIVCGLALVLSACGPARPAQTTSLPEAQPSPTQTPEWLDLELVDAKTGDTFRVNDFRGKVVLVETMAVWCPNCLRQAQELKALQASYGPDDLVFVSLDIDLHEDAAMLKEYAERNGFDWPFAVATLDVTRDIGGLYGALFLDPTLNPMLVVNRKGEVFTLGFGEKKAEDMNKWLPSFIEDGT
jgi:thiol-disulfide isomerase/thioredoxin